MMSWFWLTVPLMVLFFCCWAGIPLWHTLTRWDAELKAKHAEIAAAPAVAAPPSRSRLRLRQPRTGPTARPMREFSAPR